MLMALASFDIVHPPKNSKLEKYQSSHWTETRDCVVNRPSVVLTGFTPRPPHVLLLLHSCIIASVLLAV
jgi:hypothetical protein